MLLGDSAFTVTRLGILLQTVHARKKTRNRSNTNVLTVRELGTGRLSVRKVIATHRERRRMRIEEEEEEGEGREEASSSQVENRLVAIIIMVCYM